MKNVEDCIAESVTSSKNRSILAISNHLLQSQGKRLRPALVILSQKAVSANKNGYCKYDDLSRVAAAVELIHLASLVHDDVLDGASLHRRL